VAQFGNPEPGYTELEDVKSLEVQKNQKSKLGRVRNLENGDH